jgi:cytochrome c-type biogenesis protein CcsB
MAATTLASLSDTLAYLAVVAYLLAAVLFGFELAYGVHWVGVAGVAVTVAGLAANIATSLTRGLATRRVPWGNMYEFSVVVGILIAVGFLVCVRRRPEVRPLGVFVLLPAVAAIAVARILLFAPAGPLMPALQSGWLRIHVAAAITGSSLLCLASIFSALYLVKDRVERRAATPRPPLLAGGSPTADQEKLPTTMARSTATAQAPAEQAAVSPSGLWQRVPSARTLDQLAYRTVVFAFPIWTFAIIAGAIWAQSAWGRYWGWDPKETWSFIVWVIFAAYLHARATAGWRGRRAAWLSLVGLGCLLVNFYAVNLWIIGLHSYAGV